MHAHRHTHAHRYTRAHLHTRTHILIYTTYSRHCKLLVCVVCVCGSEIIEKQHLRDLGVTMSNNAAFQDHMKLGWMLRTFQTRDRTAMLTQWKALVIPILGYCSQLWSPWTKSGIRHSEGVHYQLTVFVKWGSQIAGGRLIRLKPNPRERRMCLEDGIWFCFKHDNNNKTLQKTWKTPQQAADHRHLLRPETDCHYRRNIDMWLM